jgi:hypothetical protein
MALPSLDTKLIAVSAARRNPPREPYDSPVWVVAVPPNEGDHPRATFNAPRAQSPSSARRRPQRWPARRAPLSTPPMLHRAAGEGEGAPWTHIAARPCQAQAVSRRARIRRSRDCCHPRPRELRWPPSEAQARRGRAPARSAPPKRRGGQREPGVALSQRESFATDVRDPVCLAAFHPRHLQGTGPRRPMREFIDGQLSTGPAQV